MRERSELTFQVAMPHAVHPSQRRRPSAGRRDACDPDRLGGWRRVVHAYTAVGAVLALLMVHFAYQGEVETVLWLFLAAMVVDGSDGMLARHFRVKDVVPRRSTAPCSTTSSTT